MSLWELQDERAADLMVTFYKELLLPQQQPPSSPSSAPQLLGRAAALRKAQLATLNKVRGTAGFAGGVSPIDRWGAFVLYGDFGPL